MARGPSTGIPPSLAKTGHTQTIPLDDDFFFFFFSGTSYWHVICGSLKDCQCLDFESENMRRYFQTWRIKQYVNKVLLVKTQQINQLFTETKQTHTHTCVGQFSCSSHTNDFSPRSGQVWVVRDENLQHKLTLAFICRTCYLLPFPEQQFERYESVVSVWYLLFVLYFLWFQSHQMCRTVEVSWGESQAQIWFGLTPPMDLMGHDFALRLLHFEAKLVAWHMTLRWRLFHCSRIKY